MLIMVENISKMGTLDLKNIIVSMNIFNIGKDLISFDDR
jgi:hypothetical protein